LKHKLFDLPAEPILTPVPLATPGVRFSERTNHFHNHLNFNNFFAIVPDWQSPNDMEKEREKGAF
jgi:hypothetical protein